MLLKKPFNSEAGSLWKYNLDTDERTEQKPLTPTTVTCATTQGDGMILGCLDGKVYLVNKQLKVEKTANLHTGPVLCVQRTKDGSSILTSILFLLEKSLKIFEKGGSDGTLQLSSRSLLPRGKLYTSNLSLFTFAVSEKQVILGHGRDLVRTDIANAARSTFVYDSHIE